MIRQKILQLNDILNNMTSAQTALLALKDGNTTLYGGDIVLYMLLEYGARYMICDSVVNFLYKWGAYNDYKLPDFIKAYNALYNTSYNPLDNYAMHESFIDLTNHGETDRTRSTSEEHNTVTTANNYDYTQTTAASSEDTPTTKNYTTTYDNDSTGRLASYSTTEGATTVNTAADIDNNYTTVTDDLTIINSETHTPTSMTIGDTTYTADNIVSHELDRSGIIGTVTSQDMIKQEIEVRAKSLLYDYIYNFIERYTFYAQGGECYDYSSL